jgi:hypothetical protein
MQHFQQPRVYEQGLWLTHQLLGGDHPPQRLQEAPELPHPPVQRGRVEPRYPREQVRKEPLGVAQKRPFALHAPKLLEELRGVMTSESESRFMDS